MGIPGIAVHPLGSANVVLVEKLNWATVCISAFSILDTHHVCSQGHYIQQEYYTSHEIFAIQQCVDAQSGEPCIDNF